MKVNAKDLAPGLPDPSGCDTGPELAASWTAPPSQRATKGTKRQVNATIFEIFFPQIGEKSCDSKWQKRIKKIAIFAYNRYKVPANCI
jgi:hypothetical protein